MPSNLVFNLEENVLDKILQTKVLATLVDAAPSISQSDVFAALKTRHEVRKSAHTGQHQKRNLLERSE